jgi:hypothetical protein
LSESTLGFPPIQEFTVPSSHIPRIMSWLVPSTYSEHPPVIPNFVVGVLKIRAKGGRTLVATWYSAGHNPPLFTIDGHDYFWGDGPSTDQGWAVDGGVALGQVILKAHEDATGTRKDEGK